MEKIKASEILAMNGNLTTGELEKFKFFAVDRDGRTYVYNPKPTDFLNDWAFSANVNGGDFTFIKVSKAPLEWRESLREIDFSEYEPPEDEIKHAMGCMGGTIRESSFYPLFEYLANAHDLVLTEEEIREIVSIAQKIKLPHETQN
jgi:hypothetical protein